MHLQHDALALQCADNKLMLVAAHGLEQLSRRYGDRIRELETEVIIEAFDTAFDMLGAELERRPRES